MRKINSILTILAIVTLPGIGFAAPWKINVDTHNPAAKKAHLLNIVSPGFEKDVSTTDIADGKFSFKYDNADGQLQVFRIVIDEQEFKPVFFAANNDMISLDFTGPTDVKLSGNKAADTYSAYWSVQNRENEEQGKISEGLREIGIDSSQRNVLYTISKNKLAATANEKIKIIQDTDDPTLSAYLAYVEVFNNKTDNIELYNKYHDALGNKAQKSFWAKYVQDVVDNFDAYQLLRQSSTIKPDQLKARYESLPEAQKKSGFGQDIQREIQSRK